MNLKNPDLDLIRSMMIMIMIHDPFLDLAKKTQNPFLDSRIRFRIFPKGRTLRLVTCFIHEIPTGPYFTTFAAGLLM